MAAFTIGGDWTWTGAMVFSGASISAPITGDIQMEAGGTARFDSAFGATGDVRIADSNATHLQLGNLNCAIDLSCTSYTFSASGAISLLSAASMSLDAPTLDIGTSACTALNIGRAAATWVANANIFGLTSANAMTLSSGTGLTLDGANFVHVGVGTGGATSTTIGNVVALTNVNINSATLNIFTLGNADMQATGATTICSSAGTSLSMGNAACATEIDATSLALPNLPGSAPGGSVNVLWDPVGNKLYHA